VDVSILPEKAGLLQRGGKRRFPSASRCPSFLAGSGASILQKAEIRLINQTVCNQLLTDQLTPRMMCVGVLTGGVDACQVSRRSGLASGRQRQLKALFIPAFPRRPCDESPRILLDRDDGRSTSSELGRRMT